MASEAVDTSGAIWHFLKYNVEAVAVRDCLVSGADSVFESGDITADVLSANENARRADAELLSCALAIAVQDAGEELTRWPNVFEQPVVVRVYDRFRGYRNIRATREALKGVLSGTVINLDSGGGILTLRYAGRVGHRYEPVYAVEYEAVAFTAIVRTPED